MLEQIVLRIELALICPFLELAITPVKPYEKRNAGTTERASEEKEFHDCCGGHLADTIERSKKKGQ